MANKIKLQCFSGIVRILCVLVTKKAKVTISLFAQT